MSRRTSLAKFLAIVAVLGLAISCAPAGAPAPEGKEAAPKPAAPAATPAPKTMAKLVFAKGYGGHDTFIPRLETADRKSDLELLYDYLVGSTPDLKLTVEGGLSKSWTMLPDGNGWTFELKKGIKFHDGSEVTAKDAKFSLECLLKEGSLSTNISYFKKALDKVDLIDDYTFTVHTKGRRVL
ncbi:MAG: ABC transporter substrate-binding protein, partial [Chloroflexota bacterium]